MIRQTNLSPPRGFTSRRAKRRRCQQFLDQCELADALGGGSGAFGKKIVLLHNPPSRRNVSVDFILHAFKARQMDTDLIGREQASDLGNKPRQLPCEVGVVGGGTGKVEQFLTDKVVESICNPEP